MKQKILFINEMKRDKILLNEKFRTKKNFIEYCYLFSWFVQWTKKMNYGKQNKCILDRITVFYWVLAEVPGVARDQM